MLKNIYFAENNDKVRAQMKDYLNHYLSEVRGQKDISYDTSKTLAEKDASVNQLMMAEVQKVSGINFASGVDMSTLASNPNVQWAVMAVMNELVDYVLPDTLIKNIGAYADFITGDYGNSYSFEIKNNDLFAVSKAGRNQRTAEIQRAYSGQVTIVPVNHELTIGSNLYRIMAGLDSLAEFAAKLIISITTEMRLESYNLLNSSMSALSTSPTGGNLKVAGFTKSDAIALAQRVSAFNGGNKAIFTGTRSALSQMTPDTATFRYGEDSTLFKLGIFRTYYGYDMLEMEQVAKWNDKFKLLLDDSKIFVVSPSVQKLMKICYEGSQNVSMLDSFHYANNQQTITVNKSWGMGIATNAVGGVIVLS